MTEMPALEFPGLTVQEMCYAAHMPGDTEGSPEAALAGGIRHRTTDLAVVTATTESGEPCGTATTSTYPLSAEPPTLISCVDRASALGRQLLRTKHFCVNILADTHSALAEAFSVPDSAGSFPVCRWSTASNGSPILEEAIAYFECTVELVYAYPEHLLVVGQVENLDSAAAVDGPLVHDDHSFTHAGSGDHPGCPVPAPTPALVPELASHSLPGTAQRTVVQ